MNMEHYFLLMTVSSWFQSIYFTDTTEIQFNIEKENMYPLLFLHIFILSFYYFFRPYSFTYMISEIAHLSF